MNNNLDGKGFVFLDAYNRPYRCCMYLGKPWLMYWHPDNMWVTLREITQAEVWSFPRNLSQEQQEVYL